MRLVKYIFKNKISSIVIIILSALLIILSSKYYKLKSYVDSNIVIESWGFAVNNFGIIELLEQDNIQEDRDKKIHKLCFEMYDQYNEICRAYGMSGVSGEKNTFDNRLVEILHDDLKNFNYSEIVKIHKMIEEVLIEHKVCYKDLENYMNTNEVDYSRLLVKEWKEIIIKLNSLSF
ncbi:hypothetical protein [Vallitalea maricola]|uniref:Uncharacterized protein n=1 Tax=Vallitalea maricola TaxID=3074433 RepID=A0ACB5UHX9_9FIRM|nr:hypothetical protein AN2V17_13690 [Vallitalea sp. AN17-2]